MCCLVFTGVIFLLQKSFENQNACVFKRDVNFFPKLFNNDDLLFLVSGFMTIYPMHINDSFLVHCNNFLMLK